MDTTGLKGYQNDLDGHSGKCPLNLGRHRSSLCNVYAMISSLHYTVFRILTKIHDMLFPTAVPKLGI